MKIWAIIPARAGSKGISNKNIIKLGDHPLIAWSITAAKGCKKIDRVIVNTDSEKIGKIAVKYGAEVPFYRPQELAGDTNTDLEWVLHALDIFKLKEGVPDLIVHLRPTTPFRAPVLIDAAINIYSSTEGATSLRSVHELDESPYKMFRQEGGLLYPYIGTDFGIINLPRQYFAPCWVPNGYVDVLNVNFIQSNKELHGQKIVAYSTPYAVEIDTLANLHDAKLKVNTHPTFRYPG